MDNPLSPPGCGQRSTSNMKKLVRHQIELAFPTLPKPEAEAAVEPTYCVEHIHEHLVGRLWTEPSVEDYRFCEDGFSLLTVVGLHYYLPGYLTAELKAPETADVIAEYATYTLGGDSDFAQQRLQELGDLMMVPQIAANTYESNK